MNGKKTKPVPRASRNFPDAKTRNKKKFDNWTLDNPDGQD